MILIAHRGNIFGPNPIEENSPKYLLKAIDQGYHVETDLWFIDDQFMLGHDKPMYPVDKEFLYNPRVWTHCKNNSALFAVHGDNNIHSFWHDTDDYTITSRGIIWSYPNKKVNSKTIMVLPEMFNTEVQQCYGICSDYIFKYKT